MIALLLAAALVQPAPSEERPEDRIGRPYRPAQPPPPTLFSFRIESRTANLRTEFSVRRWGREGEAADYYIHRRAAAGQGSVSSGERVNSRDCPAFLPLLSDLANLRFAPLYVRGISPELPPATERSGRIYSFSGTPTHPTGQGGEMEMTIIQVEGAEPDPFARWAQAFAQAFEDCPRR